MDCQSVCCRLGIPCCACLCRSCSCTVSLRPVLCLNTLGGSALLFLTVRWRHLGTASHALEAGCASFSSAGWHHCAKLLIVAWSVEPTVRVLRREGRLTKKVNKSWTKASGLSITSGPPNHQRSCAGRYAPGDSKRSARRTCACSWLWASWLACSTCSGLATTR